MFAVPPLATYINITPSHLVSECYAADEQSWLLVNVPGMTGGVSGETKLQEGHQRCFKLVARNVIFSFLFLGYLHFTFLF
jgi:hypothetical protein